MIITDMSDRERKKLARQVRECIDLLNGLATALDNSDDGMAMARFALFTISCGCFTELSEIFVDATIAKIPDNIAKLREEK